MPRRRKWHGRRQMLNLPGHQSTAAIVAEIEDTGPANPSQSRRDHIPYATLQISNCDRSISFEIDGFRIYGDEPHNEYMENDIHKINALIDALTEFRDGLLVEQSRFRRRRKR